MHKHRVALVALVAHGVKAYQLWAQVYNEGCQHIVVTRKSVSWIVQGTILPGVTRKSVIQLARQLGYEVEEIPVTITEAMEADEIFTTGTAVVVSAVGSLTYRVSLVTLMLF